MVQLVVGYYNPFMDSCFHCIVVVIFVDILLDFGCISYTIIDPRYSFGLEHNCFGFACELEQNFVQVVGKME
tara:strand:- start:700 stop:915 length:216 start_codon:yes stop_codon:yes gene_type:complete